MPYRVSNNFKAHFSLLALALTFLHGSPQAHAQPETPVTVFQEDFESYRSTAAFKRFWGTGSGSLVTNAPGGGKVIRHNGARFNRHPELNLAPDAEHNLVLSADFYDFGTNIDRRVAVCLVNTNGDLFAIGLVGASPYVIKAVGFTEKTNWVAFKRGQIPRQGWHHLQATLSMTNVLATIDLGTIGRIDKKLNLPLTRPPPTFTEICLGGHTSGSGWHSPVLVDNIKVQMVPIKWRLPLYTPRPPTPSEQIVISPGRAETNLATAIPTNNLAETKFSASTAAASNGVVAESKNTPPALPSPAAKETGASVPATSNSALWAICAALTIIVGLLAYVLIVLRRATAGAYQIPETPLEIPGSAVSSLVVKSGDQWKNRALNAEALAARQAPILEEKVGPELVEFAKDTLVQGLYKQRTALAQTQATAQHALTELEKRLADLDLPARDRLKAYEKRIAELEKDLETRNDEMRELTRATLVLMRKKMQEEREGGGQKFN
jgi:hypothetical protein